MLPLYVLCAEQSLRQRQLRVRSAFGRSGDVNVEQWKSIEQEDDVSTLSTAESQSAGKSRAVRTTDTDKTTPRHIQVFRVGGRGVCQLPRPVRAVPRPERDIRGGEEEGTRAVYLPTLGKPRRPGPAERQDVRRVDDQTAGASPVSGVDFYRRAQNTGKTPANYISEVWHRCSCAMLDEMIRDRVVSGLLDESLQQRLLPEGKALTLKKMVDIVSGVETASSLLQSTYHADFAGPFMNHIWMVAMDARPLEMARSLPRVHDDCRKSQSPHRSRREC